MAGFNALNCCSVHQIRWLFGAVLYCAQILLVWVTRCLGAREFSILLPWR
jgi:hypothetical protein